MKITPKQMLDQFTRVTAAGWLPYFQKFAEIGKTTKAHALAIGSRETNLRNIKGDFRGGVYHGFGVSQVDIGTDPAYCRAWTPQNVEAGITRGGEIYLGKLRDVAACTGKKVKVKNKTFTGKRASADDARRIATAAYNCGRWAHYHFSQGEHIDSTTTGHDYSRDVYDRAVYFAAFLEGNVIERSGKKLTLKRDKSLKVFEPGALAREIELQGKYARPEHAALVSIDVAPRESAPLGEQQVGDAELDAIDSRNSADVNLEPTDQSPKPEPGNSTPDLPTDPATEQKTTQTTEENGTKTETSAITKNEQDVTNPAVVVEPEPQGFGKKLGAGIVAIFGGTMIYDAAGKFAGIQFSMQTVYIVIVLIIFGFLGFVVWMVLDAWKANQRVKHQVEANSDPTRRDVVYIPRSMYKSGDFIKAVDSGASESAKPQKSFFDYGGAK